MMDVELFTPFSDQSADNPDYFNIGVIRLGVAVYKSDILIYMYFFIFLIEYVYYCFYPFYMCCCLFVLIKIHLYSNVKGTLNLVHGA